MRLSERELADWITYYHLEPWGPERADLNAAMVTSMLANIHRDSTKRPEPFSPADFMPHFGPREEERPEGMTPEEILAAFDKLIMIQDRRGVIVRR